MENHSQFKHHNLWQDPLWGSFQEAIGRKVWLLELPGARALVLRHSLPFNLCWLEVPRGPLFDDASSLEAILQQITSLGKKEGAVFVRLSPYQRLAADRWPLTAAEGDHHPETSLLVDLTLSEEDILKQMKPKGRYNIKVAQKHGTTVESSSDIDVFYHILQKTGGRDGFGIHPKSYYQSMLKVLGQKAQLLVAKHEGRIIAGGIFVYLNDTAIYYYGASDHDFRNMMAPYLVQWEAMKEAKRRACLTYDFLGIAPEGAKDHPWAGVTDFKKKFGGHVVQYPPAKDMVIRPFWYKVYQIRKKMQ